MEAGIYKIFCAFGFSLLLTGCASAPGPRYDSSDEYEYTVKYCQDFSDSAQPTSQEYNDDIQGHSLQKRRKDMRFDECMGENWGDGGE